MYRITLTKTEQGFILKHKKKFLWIFFILLEERRFRYESATLYKISEWLDFGGVENTQIVYKDETRHIGNP